MITQNPPFDGFDVGRGGGNRTHVRGFGDLRPTIERRPYDRPEFQSDASISILTL